MDELKKTFEHMKELCRFIFKAGHLQENLNLDKDKSLEKLLEVEIVSFLAFIAASDGVISWKESQFISEILCQSVTPDKLNQFIIDKDIYSEEFEQTVPACMQIFVAFDNAVYESNGSLDTCASDMLYIMYLILSKAMLEYDGKVVDSLDEVEQEDLINYLAMLRIYMDDNLQARHTDVITGYTKTPKPVDDLEEDGVRAPKKNAVREVKAPKKKCS